MQRHVANLHSIQEEIGENEIIIENEEPNVDEDGAPIICDEQLPIMDAAFSMNAQGKHSI